MRGPGRPKRTRKSRYAATAEMGIEHSIDARGVASATIINGRTSVRHRAGRQRKFAGCCRPVTAYHRPY
jgi:hypothetical protein